MAPSWPYLPHRVIRFLPAATLALVAALIAWIMIGQARIHLREELIERARIETPWAARYLDDAPPGWVPMPWEGKNGDLVGMIADAARRNAALLGGVEINKVLSVGDFARLATHWHAQSALCHAAPQGDTRFQAGCHEVRGELLPRTWRTHFRKAFAAKYYLTRTADGAVGSGTRVDVASSLCNAAPYGVKVAALVDVASAGVVYTQRSLLDEKIDGTVVKRPSGLAAGTCAREAIRGYDGSGKVQVASAALDPKLVAWLRTQIKRERPGRFHGDEKTLPAAGEALPCDAEPASSAEKVIVASFCQKGRSEVLLGTAVQQRGASIQNQHVVSDPYYYSVPSVVDGDGTVLPAFDQLAPALDHIRDLGKIAANEFALEMRWKGKPSPFMLGGLLHDDNSVLAEGVSIRGLPRLTVWKEEVGLPADGEIVQINNRPVFSVWDICEELSAHGHSRAFGAQVPISLVFRVHGPNGVEYKQGTTRLLFDMSMPQEFDTQIPAWWLGLKSGLSARWYLAACFVTENVKMALNMLGAEFVVLPLDECAWIMHQQVAYMLQIAPVTFNVAESIGRVLAIIVVTKSLAVFGIPPRLALAQTSTAFSYLKITGWLQAKALASSLDAIWTIGMQPPSTPIQNRIYTAANKVGVNFVQSSLKEGMQAGFDAAFQ